MSIPRVGFIEFINSLPLDQGILSGAIQTEWKKIKANPAVLNQGIVSGALDISPVSSVCYAEHASKLLLLPDLSISSRSGVKSVLLFSRKPIQELDKKTVMITAKGKTTPALSRVIFNRKYGIQPKIEFGRVHLRSLSDPRMDAVLLIGDDALVADYQNQGDFRVYDLAEEWNTWTQLPFVFAVWAVRREFYEENAQLTNRISEIFQESKTWGRQHREDVLTLAKQATGLPAENIQSYLDHLSYDFKEDLKRGMTRFFEEARLLGLLERVPAIEFIQGEEIHEEILR